jgi:predicted kinase
MDRPILYLMLGYPGAGKTTISKEITKRTGAVHLWADHERRAMFSQPCHSKAESDKLYAALNTRTDQLLGEGKSVVFDTSFNHYTDREYLRQIAAQHHARSVLVWVTTSREQAKACAVNSAHAAHNTYTHPMSSEEFDRIADHLETPTAEEKPIEIDGMHLDDTVMQKILEDGN